MDRIGCFSEQTVELSVKSKSRERTIEIGRVFGSFLPAGSVISLEGGLGVGKTLFAGGICAGLGVMDKVLSPTFILLEEYDGLFPIMHFDLYRLEKLEEVQSLGLIDAADGCNVVLVEWGDRLPDGVLRFDIKVYIQIVSSNERIIDFNAPENFTRALMENNVFNNGS
ncbi:tRNA (adenosine(37)-N6)-threonylcarbamoyltransferase complex ATPase subunit type 1 TsaE [bacterium]|nr:tRNA (adenosine(37)-N6)-threonylcarbamoyltransferase complex ATPase subunit type 1 TsaE [bacterium]